MQQIEHVAQTSKETIKNNLPLGNILPLVQIRPNARDLLPPQLVKSASTRKVAEIYFIVNQTISVVTKSLYPQDMDFKALNSAHSYKTGNRFYANDLFTKVQQSSLCEIP
ncbi:hypothetical protein T4D_5263 [Trichinella pseudospiralis]|uniref:Uncharacterized protein n=1 Tax=Trichinella pseudospiralis TaxID=6337 RepID=A0A0V1FUU0_TRIPS|nr:hypothetical protein T4D_5263 [Trichinella pseudospiralis]